MAATLTSSPPAADAVDPLPPGRIAMWLLLASDLMFFVGLIGAFIVLRVGNVSLFANHRKGLNADLAGWGAFALMISSVTMAFAVRAFRDGSLRKFALAFLAAMLCGCVFIGVRLHEYSNALNHHTIIAKKGDGKTLLLFDGHFERLYGDLVGYVAPLPPGTDPHVVSEADVARLGTPTKFYCGSSDFDLRYGPGKNIFYAIWFTLTGAHLVHAAAAMFAAVVLLVQILRKRALPEHAEYVGLFWHFTVFVGIALWPMLYLF